MPSSICCGLSMSPPRSGFAETSAAAWLHKDRARSSRWAGIRPRRAWRVIRASFSPRPRGPSCRFTRSLALSLAPKVRVNALAPGWIKTAWGQHASRAWQDRVIDETPLARWGTPEDVAAAACFLVSDAALFLTGQVIRVNGGSVR